eukprot:scaffold77578_cov62-Phaeocystis_antarctica.AAC.1
MSARSVLEGGRSGTALRPCCGYCSAARCSKRQLRAITGHLLATLSGPEGPCEGRPGRPAGCPEARGPTARRPALCTPCSAAPGALVPAEC